MNQTPWGKQIKLACALFLMTLILSGCWDRLEIEDRAVILGLAIDEAGKEAEKEEGEISHIQGAFPVPKKMMIRITAQIAVPGRIPLGPQTSGAAGGGGKSEKPVWVLSVVGHTMDDAMMNLQQQIASQLFFGHLRVIVVSEAFAKKGIENLNDYFRRNSEIRRLAWMMISKGNAASMMEAVPPLERVPALYLLSTLDNAVRMGKFPNDFLGIFWSAASSKGREPYLPYVTIKEDKNIEILGMAYFRKNKMVGVTKPLEIAFFMAITNQNPGGYAAFAKLPGTDEVVMYHATHRRSKISMIIQNGKPHFKITAYIEGNLEEKSSETFYVGQPQKIKQIEHALAQDAREGFYKLIKKTQQDGSDIFAFGERVRAKEPKYWNEQIRTTEKWDEVYKDISYDIDLTFKIRRVGMKSK